MEPEEAADPQVATNDSDTSARDEGSFVWSARSIALGRTFMFIFLGICFFLTPNRGFYGLGSYKFPRLL